MLKLKWYLYFFNSAAFTAIKASCFTIRAAFCYTSRMFYLISRLAAAVVVVLNNQYCFKRTCAANVVHQLGPTAKCQSNRVESADVCYKPVNRLFFIGLKSAEKPVPDNRNSTMISIQVFKVAAMMYAVVLWRFEQ
jgi:hypothetical protein